jgi:hypothetical protein
MEKIHTVTRPLWALDWLESWLGLFLAIALGTGATQLIKSYGHDILSRLLVHEKQLSSEAETLISDVVITITLFLLGHVFLVVYKRVKTRRYPGSYLYCFERRTELQEAQYVLGYFSLRCLPNGCMVASGASYDWKVGQLSQQVRWESEHVGATEERGATKCYILYDVDDRDVFKRPYKHGMLIFTNLRSEESVYRGYMQAVDPPTTSVAVYSRAYAKRFGKEKGESKLKAELLRTGGELIDSFRMP